MNIKMLEISQYIRLHPILKKNIATREKYIFLLKKISVSCDERNSWNTNIWKFYINKILGFNNRNIKNKENKKVKFNQSNYLKYRYNLLLDALFINAYDSQNKGRTILDNIINFCGQEYREKLQLAFEAFYSTSDNGIVQDKKSLLPIYEVIWKNRLFCIQRAKCILITANMSSGKSTLLNAFIGKKINKTLNDSCTSKVHYIYNKAYEDNIIYKLDGELVVDASTDILMKDNKINNNSNIYIGTRFRSKNEVDKRICLIDTPGVNCSMEKIHREITNNTIKNLKCDLLIYMFNGEYMGTEDDINHLRFIKNNYFGRIIFLINKVDKFRVGDDSIKGTLKKAYFDLKKLGFKKIEIYPISSYAAYLAKMLMYDEPLTEDEIDEIKRLMSILNRSEYSLNQYYNNRILVDNSKNLLEQLLLNSGILGLEELVYKI